MGNEFSSQLKEGGYIFKSIGGTVAGAGSGVLSTLSGHPDFSGVTKNIQNIGSAYEGTNQTVNDYYHPPTSAELQARATSSATSADLNNIRSNALGLGHLVNNAYSGGMRGVVPPSQLMAIGDPNAKMAIASTRGADRANLASMGKQFDLQSANQIGSALGNGK